MVLIVLMRYHYPIAVYRPYVHFTGTFRQTGCQQKFIVHSTVSASTHNHLITSHLSQDQIILDDNVIMTCIRHMCYCVMWQQED